jgi:hypothetical protein
VGAVEEGGEGAEYVEGGADASGGDKRCGVRRGSKELGVCDYRRRISGRRIRVCGSWL